MAQRNRPFLRWWVSRRLDGTVQYRSAATGEHRQYLEEADVRLDAVASMLARKALEGDDVAAALAKLIDRAAHFARLAREDEG